MNTRTRKKAVFFLCIISFLIFHCSGCSSILRKRVELFNNAKTPLQVVWVIKEVNTNKKAILKQLHEASIDILTVIGSKHGIKIINPANGTVPGDKAEYLFVSIWLNEQEYTKDLDTYKSITAIITLSDPMTNEVCIKALYTEESKLTLNSYQHLVEILEELIKNITKS